MEIDKNYFITAGAGAGKTTLLTDRYCQILDTFAQKKSNFGVENILVITFTQKAAAEMKQRIFNKISPQNQDEKYDFKHLTSDNREKTLKEFSQNYISTIDAFCSKIVRQHPFAAKIDPKYEILTESEAIQIRTEIINDFLDELAYPQNEVLKQILSFWDENRTKKFFLFALNHYYPFQEFFDKIKGKTCAELLQDSIRKSSPSKIDSSIIFLKAKREFFEKYASLKIDSPVIEIFKSILIDLEKISGNSSEFQKQSWLKNILEKLGNNEKYYSFTSFHQLGSKSVWQNAGLLDLYENIKSEKFVSQLEDNFPHQNIKLLHSEADEQANILLPNLCKIFEIASEKITDWKRKNQNFEYDDILQKTIQLLQQNNRIRQKLANQFQYILIDEFQDTNYSQWELIKLLAKEKNGAISRKKIFLVYDEKQSIYRFRGSDITVIQKAKQETQIPEKQIKYENFNYRSNENLVKCFNFMFKKVFPEKKICDFEAEFQKAESKAKNQFSGFVDIALLKSAKNESATTYENTCLEAKLVGKKIKEYQKFKPEIETNSTKKPCFAVLVDTRRKFVIYQHILRGLGIDTTVVGGTGFFQTQVVYDIYNLLSFLTNQNDEIALAGLLRSPLFSFSDNEIYKISQISGNNFFQKLKNSNTSIIEILEKWRTLSYQMQMDRFLEYVAEERFFYYSLLANTQAGAQKVTNFEKLKNLAAKFSGEGKGIHDFLQYLTNEIEFNQREEHSKIPVESEVIIMTIHQAKGLQFPIVIIPDITHKSKSSLVESFLIERIDGRTQLGVSIYDNFNQGKRTVLLNRIKSKIKNEELAERKRLFYVACTRAQSILCFVCQTDGKINKKNIIDYSAKTWAEYLLDIFDWNELDFPNTENDSPMQITSQKVVENNLPVNIQTYFLQEETLKKPVSKYKKIRYTSPGKKFLKFPKFTKFSVTDIISFSRKDKASDFLQKYEDFDFAKFGTALHFLLQHKIFEINNNGNRLKDYLCSKLDIENPEPYISKLKPHLENCKNSEIYNILKQKSSFVIFQEFKINYLSENKNEIVWQLFAKIDLLYQDSKSNWHLIDYKTNKGTSLEEIVESNKYDLQLQFYSYLLKKRYGIQISSARIYFSHFNKFLEIKPIEDKLLENLIEKYIQSSSLFHKPFAKTVNFSAPAVAIPKYSGKNLVILTANRSIAQTITDNCQSPYIKAYRLQDYLFRLFQYQLGNSIDSRTQHLILKEILLTDTEIDISSFTGFVDILRQAIEHFYQSCQDLTNPTKLFSNFYASYKNYQQKHNLSDDYNILDLLFSHPELIGKTDFFVLDEFYFYHFPIWKRFLNFIKKNARTFSFISISGNSLAETVCYKCINLREEVKQTAIMVFELLKNGACICEINIILTDYARYFPFIEKIFPQYGIKYQNRKGKKLKCSPVYPLFVSIFKLLLEPYKRENIYGFFSNSFAKSSVNLQLIDSILRSNKLSNFEQIIKSPETLASENDEIKALKKLKKVINKFFLVPASKKEMPSYFIEKVRDILEEFIISENQSQNQADSLFIKNNSAAFKSMLKVLQGLSINYKRLSFGKMTLTKFYNDFQDCCELEEYKENERNVGVKIFGAWESISHKAKYGFVLGMAEEIFPGDIKFNFLVPKIDIYKRGLKEELFLHWQKSYAELFLLFPEQDDNETKLQKSSFLKNIKEKEFIPKNYAISQIEYFQSLFDNNEKIYFQNPSFLRTLSERIQNISSDSLSNFEGKIDNFQKEKKSYSVSELNLLACCPMKYFFEKIISLSKLTELEKKYEKKYWGSFVHKVLEEFGKDKGFIKPLTQAFSLMKKSAEKQIKAYNFDLKNAFVKRELEKYISGIDDNKGNGILTNFLKIDEKIRMEKNWKPIEFEYKFGTNDKNFLIIENGEKKIYINGIIDRIDKTDDNKYLIYDYKTGKNNFSLIKEKLDFQLPVYYLKCKELFHNHGIICAFWNLQEAVPSAYLGDLKEGINKKKVKQFVNGIAGKNEISIDEIIAEIKKIDEKVSSGKFHYSLIGRKKAYCNSCEYKTICRYEEER